MTVKVWDGQEKVRGSAGKLWERVMVSKDSNATCGVGCVVEMLEDRQLLSAATVLASLRPLARWPAHVRSEPAIHVPVEVGQSVKAAKAAAKAAAKQAKLDKQANKNQPTEPVTPAVEPGPTVELTPKEKKAIDEANKPAVELLGTWSGTFTRNQDHAVVNGSVTFKTQKKDIATGTFDVSAIAGQSVMSTVNVGKNRAFIAMLMLNGGGQVSIAGAVTQDENSIIGRWSVQTKTGWTTGIFELKRNP